jgi:formate hydrogenlyase subunit 3/multisubunit Na+/H+ antiporter MnhD subunit
MMSGAMTALGLYGLTRVDLGMLGGLTRGWWIGLLVVGALSALFGALHAVTSTDLKRLLAYSTIDVMGVGLTALGAAGALRSLDGVAATLVVGVLVLVAAHGAFKALLFLAAGLVERASGTRDLDLLGGLARGMGRTTALVAVAVASATGVPLGAGFVGEWLVVEGLIGALGRSDAGGVVIALVALVAIALTSGLTAVAMVKLLGIGFLGRPRGEGARGASERPGITTFSLGLLAIATVGLGTVPGPFVAALSRAAGVVLGTPAGAPRGTVASVSLGAAATALRPLALVVGAAALTAAIVVLARLGSRTVRTAIAWACGRADLDARMQYTATSFAEPLQRVFADVLRPDVDLVVSHEEESREVERVLAYQSRVDDAVERGLLRPVVRAVDAIGRRARWIASGSVHRHLAYGFAALLVVLVVVR